VLCIYRVGNAPHVERLLAPLLPLAPDIRLWALDDVAPPLRQWTMGAGPGPKFRLLNELLGRGEVAGSSYVIVMDDDVAMVRGELTDLMAWAHAAHVDLTQPAHSRSSYLSHRITRRRRLALVRRTSFVEIGPVFAIGPEGRKWLLPFPDNAGMGWGLELRWRELLGQGLTMGIVDAVAMRHLVPPAAGYDASGHRERVNQELAEMGFASIEGIQTALGTWRPWQRRPPWLRESADDPG
jgi:hypothetical protein